MIRCQRGLCGNAATRVVAYAKDDRVLAVRPVCDRCSPGVQVFWPIPPEAQAAVDDPLWPETEPEKEPEES